MDLTDLPVSELAEREDALRQAFLRSGGGGTFGREPAVTAPPQTKGREVAGQDELNKGSTRNFDPKNARIVFISLISGQVETTMGTFLLNDMEVAQLAFIALNAVGRNVQEILTNLGNRYQVDKLQQVIDQQQESLRKQAEARVPTHQQVETGPVNGMSLVSAAETVDDDFIDEENDLPPTPMNKPLRKRGRPRTT